MWEFNYTDELYHHGILGMRWGIRRYQNKDGTLTPAGKRRADKMKEEYTALTGKRLIRKPTTKSAKSEDVKKPKKIKEMSDQEIKDMITRLDNEKRLASLQADTASTGTKIKNTVLKDVLAPAATEAGKSLVKDLILKIGSEKLGLTNDKTEAVDTIYNELKRESELAKFKADISKSNKTIRDNEIELQNIKEKEKVKKEKEKAKKEAEKQAKKQAEKEKAEIEYYKKLFEEVDRELGEETVKKYRTVQLPYTK